jgi:hypothetical protein
MTSMGVSTFELGGRRVARVRELLPAELHEVWATPDM